MTKAIRIHTNGGPEVMVWEDVPTPEPGPNEALVKQHAVGLELTDGGCNLIGGLALAHQRIAMDAAADRHIAPRPQRLFRGLQCACGVVVRHSGGIGGDGRGGRKHVEKNEASRGFAGLFHGERHEMSQVAQIGGDEDCGWMRPAAGLGIPHGEHLSLIHI